MLEGLSQLCFWQLRGARRVDDAAAVCLPAEIIQGQLAARRELAFLLRADGEAVRLGLGCVTTARARSLARAASVLLGGGAPAPAPRDFARLTLPAVGCLTGIPRSVAAEGSPLQDVAVADLLLDSLVGQPFDLGVLAVPALAEELQHYLDTLREEAERLDRDYLAMPQQANVHRPALRRRTWLDAMIERLEQGLAHGMWRVHTLLAAETEEQALQALGLVAGALAEVGKRGLLPLRPGLCGSSLPAAPPPETLLESSELAAFLIVPERDRLGFALRGDARFDVDHVECTEGLELGRVLDGERVTSRSLRVPSVALTRHAFVGGHTGSGKTTLVKHLLREVARQEIPFLVLEPAKGEYQALAREVEELCAFSVGKLPATSEIPFRLNPFAFPEGFSLHTHIDLLKNAFTASFGLVPPAPYLLESALYRAYESVGWQLETGEHPNGHDQLSFPTLSDLLAAIEPVIEAAGYDVEVSRNLRGALRTRVGNLCLGPKGMAVDTREDLPASFLFGRPLVLDLRHLGSDAEKAFVMSLVLMRLYEVRESAGLPEGDERLRHLLVVEEAHRLLRRQAERAGEEGNMAHEAVRAFENLISEVRAYGQGVLLVDQLPSTLSPGALKQTALRVLHRVIPHDDREIVGDVLTEEQRRTLAFLGTGQAIVHSEGMDGPIRLQAPAPTSRAPRGGVEGIVAARVRQALGPEQLEASGRLSLRAPHARTLRNLEIRTLADAVLVTAVAGRPPGPALEQLEAGLGRIAGVAAGDGSEARLLTEFALDDALFRRARHHGWSFDRLAGLQCRARSAVHGVGEALREALERERGPRPWCGFCPAPCRWGHEGRTLAEHPEVSQAAGAIAGKLRGEWITELLRTARRIGSTVFPGGEPMPPVIEACAAGFALESHGVRSGQVEAVFDLILEHQREESDA